MSEAETGETQGFENQEAFNDPLAVNSDQEDDLEDYSFGAPESPAGNEEEQESDNDEPIKAIRDRLKEEQKARKELERKLAEREQAKQEDAPIELGPRPKMADFEYDQEAYDEALDKWMGQAAAKEAQDKRRQQKEADEVARRNKILQDHRERAKALKVDRAEYDKAEAQAATLPQFHQAAILRSAKSERIVFALSRDPAAFERFAELSDPFEVAREIGAMEAKLTATKSKRERPQAESGRVVGGAPSGTSQNLQKLEAEAEKSGDYTALFAARAAARKKG